MTIQEKFERLGIDNAPGQEALQAAQALELRCGKLDGAPVDFSHGDVDAHVPTPGSFEVFAAGVEEGGAQAYTPYRGRKEILAHVAASLSAFTGAAIDPAQNVILTPGTQGALFLAMGANIMPSDKVAIVEPDYFANRKMVEFFGGEMVPIPMRYEAVRSGAGIDLDALERAFQAGATLFLFSNPNTHLCAQKEIPENLITIIGPSKTESLSGYRLGVAFGTAEIIERMEKLQAIMALRCSGYNQAVFKTWFNEPEGWMAARVAAHQEIRDAILAQLEGVPGVFARPTEGGSYLFVTIPELDVSLHQFIRILRELAAVTVTPGTEFGPQFLHHFRINFSQDKDKAVAAIQRFLTVLELYRKQ